MNSNPLNISLKQCRHREIRTPQSDSASQSEEEPPNILVPSSQSLTSMVPMASPLVAPMDISSNMSSASGSESSDDETSDEEHAVVGPSVSWVNPKLKANTSKTGSGMFAMEDCEEGEPLIVWTGKIVSAEQALGYMNTRDKHYLLQIGDGFYQVPLSKFREPADFTNHSCEPNAGFGKGSPICLSAMRRIPAGSQVLFDYAMCETDPRLWEPMECMCETPSCRKWITANDYRIPELWAKYEGFWAPHVQRLVTKLREEHKMLKADGTSSFSDEKKDSEPLSTKTPSFNLSSSSDSDSLSVIVSKSKRSSIDSFSLPPSSVSDSNPHRKKKMFKKRKPQNKVSKIVK